MLVYGPNKYNTKRMCDEAIGDCLAAIKVISNSLATSKMLEKLLMIYPLMMKYYYLMKIHICC